MSFPSGSTLKVFLLNGASPNTGPFDIYVNSVSAGNLMADNVEKATLSGSGYEFITPVDTVSVIAKSDGTITTEDAVVIGYIPGTDKVIYVTGSYDSSLTPGASLANVYLDYGYGHQAVSSIPSNLNTCPPNTVIGNNRIKGEYNTLVVVKNHETGSNLIKFYANGEADSGYFYHIPSLITKGSGVGPNWIRVCVDLAGGNYQTTPTESINVYPTSTISFGLNNSGSLNAWNELKVNGNSVYSSSASPLTDMSVPGNALIEVSGSVIKPTIDDSTYISKLTGSYSLTYGSEYVNTLVSQSQTYLNVTPDFGVNTYNYKFYAVPGGSHILSTTSYVEGRVPSDLSIDVLESQVATITASYPDVTSVLVYFEYLDTTLTTRASSQTLAAGETTVNKTVTHPIQPLDEGGSIYITKLVISGITYLTPPVAGTNVMWSWLD